MFYIFKPKAAKSEALIRRICLFSFRDSVILKLNDLSGKIKKNWIKKNKILFLLEFI